MEKTSRIIPIEISDEMIFGKELHLGYTYYLGGELLDEPLYELSEHYQEIDETEIEEPENKSFLTARVSALEAA